MTELTEQLKVLHIISGDRWAGAEVQACTLLLQLKQRVELTVVLMNHGELEERLKKNGIRTEVLDESELGSMEIFLRLVAIIRKAKPDIVHTHRKKENILGAIAALFSPGSKSLRTVHGAPEFSSRGLRWIQDRLDLIVGRYLQKAVIAVSEDLGAKQACRFQSAKIKTIVNGIDEQGISSALNTAEFKMENPEAIHVGIVGRLVPVKRIDIFLEMASLLQARYPDKEWQFHIIGDGELQVELEQLSHSLAVATNTSFHGHRSDIHDCIASLDIVVMCSDHEGLPMTALECLALDTPLLAHDVGGLAEVLSGYDRQLVTDHSAEGYCEAVMSLLDGEAPLCTLAEKYTAAANADSVHALYRKLIS